MTTCSPRGRSAWRVVNAQATFSHLQYAEILD